MSLRGAVGAGVWLTIVLAGIAGPPQSRSAEGQITRIIKNVSVALPPAGGRPAIMQQRIGPGTVVRTAPDSRVEITFSDRSLVRVGAKSILRINPDGLELEEGAMLFQAPRRSGAEMKTGAIHVELGGATGIVERFGRTYVKVMLLEGTARAFLPAIVGESVLVNPGQLLITKPEPKQLPEPVDFSIAQLYRTSVLTGREFARLPSEPQILSAGEEQKKNPQLFPTNLIIYGRGTLVTLGNPAPAAKAKPSASPGSTPGRPSR